MSDLFHAGQARRTSGSITITMKNGKELAKKLEKLKDGGEKAIKYTVSDFASRAPGWVSKGIRQHYGVDKDAIEEAQSRTKRGSGATQIKVKGISVDGAALEYKGRTLTPIHFRMSPSTLHPKGLQSKRNRIPGQAIAENASNPNAPFGMVRVPVPYQVSATVIKGSRKKNEERDLSRTLQQGKCRRSYSSVSTNGRRKNAGTCSTHVIRATDDRQRRKKEPGKRYH